METDRRATLAWLTGHLPSRLAGLALILALSLLATTAGLGQPYLTKLLIDDALQQGRLDLVAAICAALVGLACFNAGLGYWNRMAYLRLSGGLLFELREAVFRHLQTLPPSWFARSREGDLMARLDGDVAEIQRFLLDTILAAVNAVFALVGTLAAMALLSPSMTVIAFAVLPLQVLLVKWLRPVVERRTRQVREAASDLNAFFFDTLPAMKFIQGMGAEAREAERLAAFNGSYLDHLLRLERASFMAGTFPALLMAVGTAAVFVYGGAQVVGEVMTVGTLIAFSAYLARAAGPVQTLLGLWVASRRAMVSLDRVGEVMAQKAAVREPVAPLPLAEPVRGGIEFRAVYFSHDGAPLLNGLSLTLPPGAKLGIVGPSGVGKSTLIDLLQRHYDPDRGAILLDGIPLDRLPLARLRRAVAVVAQDVVLMRGSIRENLTYGLGDISETELADALAAVGLGGMVAALPQGLETPVGSHGRLLSGGQRQRLAVARALLQEPAVLVLDEPTSAVDEEAERHLLAEIDRLFAGRTRIVVSHRPAPLLGCDFVLTLPSGAVETRRSEVS